MIGDQIKLLVFGLPLGIGAFLLLRWLHQYMPTTVALFICVSAAYVLFLTLNKLRPAKEDGSGQEHEEPT